MEVLRFTSAIVYSVACFIMTTASCEQLLSLRMVLQCPPSAGSQLSRRLPSSRVRLILVSVSSVTVTDEPWITIEAGCICVAIIVPGFTFVNICESNIYNLIVSAK